MMLHQPCLEQGALLSNGLPVCLRYFSVASTGTIELQEVSAQACTISFSKDPFDVLMLCDSLLSAVQCHACAASRTLCFCS